MQKSFKIRVTRFAASVPFLLALCFASTPASNASNGKKAAILEAVQSYINSISTMKADFEEMDLQKSIKRKGVLYVSRPGKIKWDYASPDKRVIIASGNKVIYYDYALEELSTLPVRSSILQILSKAPIDLTRDCKIISIYENVKGNYVDVALTDNLEDIENILILKFIIKPTLALSNIGIMSSDGEALTEISLKNLRYGVRFEKDVFLFRDPKFFELER